MAEDRATARVLPVSPGGEVLLLREQDPARPGMWWWGAIGGRIDAGESAEEAARRELREETGITVGPEALAWVHAYRYESSYDGVAYAGLHTFFALPLARDAEVSFEHLVEEEIGNVLEAGWWTSEALELDGSAVEPELIDAMRVAVDTVRGRP